MGVWYHASKFAIEPDKKKHLLKTLEKPSVIPCVILLRFG